MHGVAAGLPEPAGMCNHIAFVVNMIDHVFLDEGQLARRTLRSRLSGGLLELIDLALQPLDPGQQFVLRNIGLTLGFVSRLSEALFQVVGRFESDKTLYDVCNRFTNRSAMFFE